MKFYSLLLISALFITSCNKDDYEIITTSSLENEVLLLDINENEPKNDKNEIIKSQVLKLINLYRKNKNLNLLSENDIANKLAFRHSKLMAKTGTLNHNNFRKRNKMLFKIESAKITAENVAFGYPSAKEVVKAWINSPKHLKNIEGDFDYSGIGIVADDQGFIYYTQILFK